MTKRNKRVNVEWRVFLLLVLLMAAKVATTSLQLEEATVEELRESLNNGNLTSEALIHAYLTRINSLNPLLRAFIEINPNALQEARASDLRRHHRRRRIHHPKPLEGIPILIKDNIATLGILNTTAGSWALFGSRVKANASIIARLRRAGAIILGKANMSEWANFRSSNSSDGWSARGGQTRNPYVLSASPSGSSSGSAVAVAANLVAISVGTETDGSILSPASSNAVVGIKPSVGLASRYGIIPISHHQDTPGPLCRTVSDAVEVLDVIVGYDALDNATFDTASFIPEHGYRQFLKKDGLNGKRIGVVSRLVASEQQGTIADHVRTMRQVGATIIDNVTIPTIDSILQFTTELTVLEYDFKADLNAYLKDLPVSPVRSLADVIQFNIDHAKEEELDVYDQALLLLSEATTGLQSDEYKNAVKTNAAYTKNGIDRVMKEKKLDALVASVTTGITSVIGIAGYPGISVPAGYDDEGVPFGIAFAGLRGSEPTLIEIAYSFEQLTHIRRPPSFLPS